MMNASSLNLNPLSTSGASSPVAEWLPLLQRQSRLLMAVLAVGAPEGPQICFANDYFCQLAGLSEEHPCGGISVLQRLPPDDQTRLTVLYRRHLINGLLKTRYGEADWIEPRLLQEPIVITLAATDGQPHQVELRLRSGDGAPHELQVDGLAARLEEILDRCWEGTPTRLQVMTQLYDAASPLNQLLEAMGPGTYQASGYLLLEGMEVSERETIRDLIELLINQDSVLKPHKFQRANALIQQLFRADDTLIISAEQERVTLFMDLEQTNWQVDSYTIEDFQRSSFFAASAQGQVVNIADLRQCGISDGERRMAKGGVRSLLLIPLVSKSLDLGQQSRRLLGLVGIASGQPYAFNQADCSNATTLIPALSAALRYTVRERFTNIHSSVRWRFEQEAERRSWGLPPEAITFEEVWPLYGISDIRGSSEERNRAIQADLIRQFELALAVVDAIATTPANAFVQQLRLDLREHLQALQQTISVDAEVTLLHYLQQEVEAHFDYFRQCSPEAQAAIAQYQAALDPEEGCVYQAQIRYDQTLQTTNQQLRDIWDQRQATMQQITPHYCDVETTDGIDHMLYAGSSIDPNFTPFHLHSLRYEQLRAVCACAQAAFSLKQCYSSDLEVSHLVLVQASTVDITHDETTERLFDVRGTRDTRYEIVKKRIDKARDVLGQRITQPGQLTVVYSTEEEWQEYQRYLRYLQRENLIAFPWEEGQVEPLQGVSGLKFVRVPIQPAATAD